MTKKTMLSECRDPEMGATANAYLYAGEQRDGNVGFYYLRARYLNTARGSFLQRDPFGGRLSDPRSLHRYVYAFSDPANNIDPSGRITLSEISVSLGINGLLRNIEILQRAWALSLPVRAREKVEALESAIFWGALGTIIPLQLSAGIVPGFKYKVETIGRESYFEMEKSSSSGEIFINFSYKKKGRFRARVDIDDWSNTSFYDVSGFAVKGGAVFIGVESDIKDLSCTPNLPVMRFGVEANPSLAMPGVFSIGLPVIPSLIDEFKLVLDYRIPLVDECPTYHRILDRSLGEFRLDF